MKVQSSREWEQFEHNNNDKEVFGIVAVIMQVSLVYNRLSIRSEIPIRS